MNTVHRDNEPDNSLVHMSLICSYDNSSVNPDSNAEQMDHRASADHSGNKGHALSLREESQLEMIFVRL